jgi:hypothetical protein
MDTCPSTSIGDVDNEDNTEAGPNKLKKKRIEKEKMTDPGETR